MPGHEYNIIHNRVALRKESVDRNNNADCNYRSEHQSLSARRAWIEIPCAAILRLWACVALRKESVDRNVINEKPVTDEDGVALRKESVDRNNRAEPSEQAQSLSLSARRAWIEIQVEHQ